jgi:NADH dehydrogenase
MSDAPRAIGVTGASGFVGRHLVAHLAARGHRVVAFQRGAQLAPAGITVRPFTLPDGIDPAHFAGLDAVVHGALVEYGPAHRDADAINREGARRVVAAAHAAGARAIFLSTLSAHADARSHYGINKLELESLFAEPRDAVLRLGLVLGNGGLFGSIVDVLKSSRVVPLPDGGRQPIQTLWMGDLCAAVDHVLDAGTGGRFDVADPTVHTMRGLYETIMRGLGVHPALVPVPLSLVHAGVTVLEALRVPFPIRAENTLGLKHLRAFDTAPSMRALGIEHPVPLEEAVRRLLARP